MNKQFSFSLLILFNRRDKQLKAEQNLRRQLEEQLDSLLNNRIAGQLELASSRYMTAWLCYKQQLLEQLETLLKNRIAGQSLSPRWIIETEKKRSYCYRFWLWLRPRSATRFFYNKNMLNSLGELSQMVLDCTISVNDRPCNYFLSGLVLSFFFFSMYFLRMAKNSIENKGARMRPERISLHELLYIQNI